MDHVAPCGPQDFACCFGIFRSENGLESMDGRLDEGFLRDRHRWAQREFLSEIRACRDFCFVWNACVGGWGLRGCIGLCLSPIFSPLSVVLALGAALGGSSGTCGGDRWQGGFAPHLTRRSRTRTVARDVDAR